MLIDFSSLRNIIREHVTEQIAREVTLSDGNVTALGSDEHLRDMYAILAGLESLKKQHSYGSAARSRFAEASAQLKRLISRFEKRKEPIKFKKQTGEKAIELNDENENVI